jgi:hypothetical protein
MLLTPILIIMKKGDLPNTNEKVVYIISQRFFIISGFILIALLYFNEFIYKRFSIANVLYDIST